MSNKKIVLPMVVVIVLICVSLFVLKQRAGHVGDFPSDMPAFSYSSEEKSNDASGSGFLPTSVEDPVRFEAWTKAVQSLKECLGVKAGEISAQDDANIESLGKILTPEFGAPAKIEDKWSSVDYRTKVGEIRRLFVEYSKDAKAPDAPAVKKVSHYTMLVSGNVRDIKLSDDLQKNPSDEQLSKVFADQRLISMNRSRVAVFNNGDQLQFVEKNGKVRSFSITHAGKNFRCADADVAASMKCSCN